MMAAVETLRHLVLVDDNPDVRLHLGNLLVQMGYAVEVLEDPRPLLARTRWPEPAVVLLDMRMPILSGLEVQRGLAAVARQVPIVFISGESQTQEVVQALKGGAVDFLVKPFGQEELERALSEAFAHGERLRGRLQREDQVRARLRDLSPRERRVLPLLLQGHSNKALGEQLDIQADTVKKHRAAIYDKFLVDDLSGLIALFQGLETGTFEDG